MMSLQNTSNLALIFKQVKFKWNAWVGTVFSLLLIQVIGTVLSIMGSGGSTMYSDGLVLKITYNSGDTIFFLTLFWMAIQAFTFASKNFRDLDYSFITTRHTSHLSTVIYLIILSVFAAVLTLLFSNVVRVILYFKATDIDWSGSGYFLSASELLLGLFSMSLYLMIIASITYMFGTLAAYKNWLIIVLPPIIIGSLIVEARTFASESWMLQLITAFVWEESLLMFAVKAVMLIGIMFSVSYLVNARMEVRK